MKNLQLGIILVAIGAVSNFLPSNLTLLDLIQIPLELLSTAGVILLVIGVVDVIRNRLAKKNIRQNPPPQNPATT